MKKKQINKVISIFIVSLFFFLSIKASSQDTIFNNKYFTLLNTYSTLEQVYKSHPELKPEESSIVITKDNVIFYNENKKEIKRIDKEKDKVLPENHPKYSNFENVRIHSMYYLFDNHLLGIRKQYTASDNYQESFDMKIYNKKGEFLTSIKPTHNITLSKDKKYFVSSSVDEVGNDSIYIYNFETGLHPSVFIGAMGPNVRISKDSNFIKIFDSSIATIYIIDRLGKVVFSYKLKSGILFNYFVSQFCDKILVSLFIPDKPMAILLNREEEVIWKSQINRILDCQFINNDRLLLTLIKGKKRAVVAIDSSGEQLEEIICEEVIVLEKNYIIIKKEGRIYEYKI